MELNHCFVCGKDNPRGLHIAFEKVGDEVVAEYRCTEEMNGWPGIQHGGITASLLDEAAGYVPHFLGLVAMTAKLDIRYLEPIQSGERLRITGRPVKRTSRLIEVEAKITGEEGQLKAQANASMIVLTERQLEKWGLASKN
ncbi:PaaI family thioesterase [Cohnella caldifontis]|uniref:PaaI family thioesterase n=1 Tax=Cohnella caldifontis TaxID=3027471 RepID=UPI0023EBF996|nr:PaaI family thioesterase [Cohnella sp. YIM B05605]